MKALFRDQRKTLAATPGRGEANGLRFKSGFSSLSTTASRRAFLAGAGGAGLALTSILPALAQTKVWRAGNYSFSDELGGFAIRAIAGKGSRASPIIIEQEFYSASPVTLTVRAAAVADTVDDVGNLATSALFFTLVTLNASGQSWIEFEFELQEILNHPSEFGDGLSFDQRRENVDNIHSTAFKRYSRDFEPYDRLRFSEGKVDPRETAEFEFALTDFTPRWTFYIVQDPRIPSS